MYGEEIIKFDCFGKDRGHFHIALYTPGASNISRIFLPEPSIEEQIERAIFEIQRNIEYYMQRNTRRKIRKLRIDRNRIGVAGERAKSKMYEFIR